MFASIRLRLTFSHLIVIILAMGLSGFLLLSFLEQYFLQALEDSLVAQARITAQTLIPEAAAQGPPVQDQSPAYNTVQQQRQGNLALQTQNISPPTADLPPDLNNLNNATVELSALLDTHIRLLDAEGVVIIDSRHLTQGQTLAHDPLVAQALTGRYARRTDDSIFDIWGIANRSAGAGNLEQEPAMHLALPVMVEDSIVGVVYLSQPLRDVIAVLNDVRRLWVTATLIALGLSALVGLLLSRAIANPVRRLTAAANAVAAGRLDQQVPVKSNDELGRLSRSFNQMTTRLQAARQMQLDMVSNVSHELRTPLTSIKGLLETLRGGAVDDPEVRDSFLEMAEDQANRLIRMVKDLLLLSRVDTETLRLQKTPTSLPRLVQDTVDYLSFQAEGKDLHVDITLNTRCDTINIDPDRIEQVLLNLLDNAIKYSTPGGGIFITARDETEHVLIEIKDEGIGIPSDELQRIGERFYRADKARSRAEGGSGLGLAIARSLVEAHGGTLWLDSEEGRGTVVRFILPC